MSDINEKSSGDFTIELSGREEDHQSPHHLHPEQSTAINNQAENVLAPPRYSPEVPHSSPLSPFLGQNLASSIHDLLDPPPPYTPRPSPNAPRRLGFEPIEPSAPYCSSQNNSSTYTIHNNAASYPSTSRECHRNCHTHTDDDSGMKKCATYSLTFWVFILVLIVTFASRF